MPFRNIPQALLLLLFALPMLMCGQRAPAPLLTSGPFASAVTTTSARIWFSIRGRGLYTLTLEDTADKSNNIPVTIQKTFNSRGDTALICDFSRLKPGHVYQVRHCFRSILKPADCIFTTKTDTTVKDIDFLAGSCAFMNTDITRILFPGPSSRIFRHMAHTPADFMVWLGDNIYYMGDQYKTYQNMFDRNIKIRKLYPVLNNFLASMPQYAIWDDHDYGPNDSDKRWYQKDTALMVFKGFWPNPYEDSISENYFSFRYYDVEVYMTDDRWFRDPDGDTSGAFFGPQQMAWLKDKLKKSDATFKFLCIGSQVINDNNAGESYANYPKERNDLLNYIVDNNIKGVIFITGDKHYAELSKRDWRGYTFYDFTTSPLTSPMDPRNRMHHNRHRIENTVYFHKNYGRIRVTGPAGARECKLSLYNKDGKLKWDYIIKTDELQVPLKQSAK